MRGLRARRIKIILEETLKGELGWENPEYFGQDANAVYFFDGTKAKGVRITLDDRYEIADANFLDLSHAEEIYEKKCDLETK